MGYSEYIGPFLKRVYLTIELYHMIIRPIIALMFHIYPTAVFGAIIAIHVNTVYCETFFPAIFLRPIVEGIKTMAPLRTYCYPAPAIISVIARILI